MDYEEFLFDLSQDIQELEISLLNLNDARDVIYSIINKTFLKILQRSQNILNNKPNELLFKSIQK